LTRDATERWVRKLSNNNQSSTAVDPIEWKIDSAADPIPNRNMGQKLSRGGSFIDPSGRSVCALFQFLKSAIVIRSTGEF